MEADKPARAWELLPTDDERLTQICKPIPPDDISSAEVQETIDTMLAIASGERDIGPGKAYMVGLAGPQIGIMQRIIVVDMDIRLGIKPKEEAEIPTLAVLINPEIVEHSSETEEFREGCFSFHAKEGIYGVVPRYESVKVKAYDRDGKPVEVNATGYTARILQHEIDHLDGVRYHQRMLPTQQLDEVRPQDIEAYKDEGWKNWPHQALISKGE